MSFEDVIRLNSRVTLQQMLQREDFKARIEEQHPIRAHEVQYPIMQGWDSVMVKADVELGGTDQLFNILIGRDFQREEGMPQQVVFLLPILEGLDGFKKMSKSLGNYVAINDSPSEMFGKLMSISDELMARYYELLLRRAAPQRHASARGEEAARVRNRADLPLGRTRPKEHWMNGTRASASATWSTPICRHFHQPSDQTSQPSTLFRMFIGTCSSQRNRTAKSRD